MTNKRNFWVNVAVFLVPSVLLLILNLAFGERWEASGELWLTYTLLFFNFFYFLGYEHFWYRPKLAKFFRILGLIFNILLGAFSAMICCELLSEDLTVGAGKNCFTYGLYMVPVLLALFRRSIYELAFYKVFSDKTNLILSFAVPVGAYILSVLFSLVSPLYMTIGAFVVWYLVRIYIRGYVKKIDFFLVNTVFHLGVLILGVVLSGLNAVPAEMLVSTGCMSVGCGYFFTLGYDLCSDRVDYESGYKYHSSWAVRWIVVGSLAVVGFGIFATVEALNTNFLEGMQFGLRCGFDHAFAYALYFAPVFYAFTRYYFYDVAWKRNWSSLMRLTVTLAYPVICYIVAVISLLIGALWFILALALVTGIITLINYKKYKNSEDGDDTIGFNDFIEDKSEEEKLDDRFSGIGLDEYLSELSTDSSVYQGSNYYIQYFQVSRSYHTIYASGVIDKSSDYDSARESVRSAISAACRRYQANYTNTQSGPYWIDLKRLE